MDPSMPLCKSVCFFIIVLVLQTKPLLQLALADFLASLVLMCTAIINLPYEIWPLGEKLCNNGLPLSLVRN